MSIKKRIKKLSLIILGSIAGIASILFAVNRTADIPKTGNDFEIIAHRGVHQDYEGSAKGLRRSKAYLTECTATRIFKPTHPYLENTVESIQAAFDYGATIVEIDIRPTKDNQLVVFHDWMLGCRTNVQGNVIDHTVEDLKQLDIGYGYTHDGKTYPFRGKGIGKIETLTDVLNRFPDKRFLIDNKNGNNLETAQLIVDTLSQFSEERQKQLYLWCQDKAYEHIKQQLPSVKRLILPRNRHKTFFKSYLLNLGFSEVPNEYKNQGIGLPLQYTKFIWGWPNRFLGKIYKADMKFYLYINTMEEAKKYSDIPISGIVTDRIEDVGEYYSHLKFNKKRE